MKPHGVTLHVNLFDDPFTWFTSLLEMKFNISQRTPDRGEEKDY